MNELLPQHQRIYEDFYKKINDGLLRPGDKLPTEEEIAKEYSVSRPTVTKAMARLQDAKMIIRKRGAGTFVTVQESRIPAGKSTYFGLLIPMLGVTEIFEPICARIAQLSVTYDFHVLWDNSSAHTGRTVAEDLEQACERYIKNKVDGIFFVPLELVPSREQVNIRIVSKIKTAKIPLVLIDADYLPFGKRSSFDLVGIDNIRTGYEAAKHFLAQGAKRIDFVYRSYSAYTVEQRILGYKLALLEAGIAPNPAWIHSGSPKNSRVLQEILDSGANNIICANDATALDLMMKAYEKGLSVPEDLRLIGYDNVKIFRYARVPLTTFRQPCAQIGDLAVNTMYQRIAHPDRPAVTVYAEAPLIIRESSKILVG